MFKSSVSSGIEVPGISNKFGVRAMPSDNPEVLARLEREVSQVEQASQADTGSDVDTLDLSTPDQDSPESAVRQIERLLERHEDLAALELALSANSRFELNNELYNHLTDLVKAAVERIEQYPHSPDIDNLLDRTEGVFTDLTRSAAQSNELRARAIEPNTGPLAKIGGDNGGPGMGMGSSAAA